MIAQFLENIVKDISTELMEEFDKNFEHKGFLSDKWKDTKFPNRRGSLMLRSGKLRRSLEVSVTNNIITFSSSLPYAKIHNEGGKIKVTEKMKRYFWYLYKQATGGITYSLKTKQAQKTKRNRNLSADAEFYKSMALKKVGDVIIIEKRQFIGYHPDQDGIVQRAIDRNINELNTEIEKVLRQK